MADTNLILFIIVPFVAIFILLCFIYLIYKSCNQKAHNEDDMELLLPKRNQTSNVSNEAKKNEFQFDDDSFINEVQDVALANKVNNDQRSQASESREAAFIYLQFFLRSNSNKGYQIVEHFGNIGSNKEKNWFLVAKKVIDKTRNSKIVNLKMLSLYKINGKRMIRSINDIFSNVQTRSSLEDMIVKTQEQAKLLKQLFFSLKCSYLLDYDTIDINFEQNYVLIMSGYSKDGSLKDLIYNADPADDWNNKYYMKSQGLSLDKIKDYSKQILSALLYLKSRMMPPLTQLHSGNIILSSNKKVCLVSGHEYLFIGTKSRVHYIFNKNVKKLKKYEIISEQNKNVYGKKYPLHYYVQEILSFGHVFYEMASGCELNNLYPLPNDIARIEKHYATRDSQEIIKFLNYIFHNTGMRIGNHEVNSSKYCIPCLDHIILHEFLNSSKINSSPNLEFNELYQSNEIKEFLQFSMSQIKQSSSEIKKKIKNNQTKNYISQNNDQENLFNTTKSTSLNTSAAVTAQSTLHNASPAPSISSPSVATAPPPPPPPPPSSLLFKADFQSQDDTHVMTNERSALLDDIRKGKQLKKAKTIDKSKPKF